MQGKQQDIQAAEPKRQRRPSYMGAAACDWRPLHGNRGPSVPRDSLSRLRERERPAGAANRRLRPAAAAANARSQGLHHGAVPRLWACGRNLRAFNLHGYSAALSTLKTLVANLPQKSLASAEAEVEICMTESRILAVKWGQASFG